MNQSNIETGATSAKSPSTVNPTDRAQLQGHVDRQFARTSLHCGVLRKADIAERAWVQEQGQDCDKQRLLADLAEAFAGFAAQLKKPRDGSPRLPSQGVQQQFLVGGK
jgi:hypothetical protein